MTRAPHPHDHPDVSHDYMSDDPHLELNERRTYWVVWLTTVTMVVEIVVGYWSGSMSLLADGWHMASHSGAMFISLMAYRWARNEKLKASLTFGAGKLIPLAGYTSALILAAIAVSMIMSSILRIYNPVHIHYEEALGVVVVGLLVNLLSALLLHKEHGEHFHLDRRDRAHAHHDHNLQSAYVHVLADALTSILALGALVLAWKWDWVWLDPAIGILGGIVILKWAYGLIKETSWELLDGESPIMNLGDFREFLENSFPIKVLDLHVWRIAPRSYCCEVSLCATELRGSNVYRDKILERYNFAHLMVEERCE